MFNMFKKKTQQVTKNQAQAMLVAMKQLTKLKFNKDLTHQEAINLVTNFDIYCLGQVIEQCPEICEQDLIKFVTHDERGQMFEYPMMLVPEKYLGMCKKAAQHGVEEIFNQRDKEMLELFLQRRY